MFVIGGTFEPNNPENNRAREDACLLEPIPDHNIPSIKHLKSGIRFGNLDVIIHCFKTFKTLNYNMVGGCGFVYDTNKILGVLEMCNSDDIEPSFKKLSCRQIPRTMGLREAVLKKVLKEFTDGQ